MHPDLAAWHPGCLVTFLLEADSLLSHCAIAATCMGQIGLFITGLGTASRALAALAGALLARVVSYFIFNKLHIGTVSYTIYTMVKYRFAIGSTVRYHVSYRQASLIRPATLSPNRSAPLPAPCPRARCSRLRAWSRFSCWLISPHWWRQTWRCAA